MKLKGLEENLMGLLERDIKQKIITGWTLGVVVLGMVLFSALVIVNASQFGGAPPLGIKEQIKLVELGPLELMEISKTALQDGGYQAMFRFKSGIIWYLLGLVAIGLGLGFLRAKAAGKQLSKKD
jgi:hypothetical protein